MCFYRYPCLSHVLFTTRKWISKSRIWKHKEWIWLFCRHLSRVHSMGQYIHFCFWVPNFEEKCSWAPWKSTSRNWTAAKSKLKKKINQKLSQGICRRTKCAKFQTNQLRFGLWECPEVLGYKSTHRYTDTHTDTQQHRHSQIITQLKLRSTKIIHSLAIRAKRAWIWICNYFIIFLLHPKIQI